MKMTNIEPAGPPMPAVAQILSRYDRGQVENFIEIAVAMLDTLDGDADLEADDRGGETLALPDTDEMPEADDGTDPDLEETDCEDAFVLSSQATGYLRGPGCIISDPDKGVDDEGEAIDEAEPDESRDAFLDYGIDQSEPLPPHLAEDRVLRRPHIERVRREKCRQLARADRWGRTHELVGE